MGIVLALGIALVSAPTVLAFQAKSKPSGKSASSSSDKPSPYTFSSDDLTCPYLTKPSVRKDGGGMNSHAGGSIVCYEDKLMHCLGGRWQSRGPCSAYGSTRQAYEIEGTDPPDAANKPDEGDASGGASSGSGRSGGAGSSASRGGLVPGRAGEPALLGSSPLEQSAAQAEADAESTAREIERRNSERAARPSKAAGRTGGGRAQGSSGSGTNGGAALDPAFCEKGRASLAYADDAIASTIGNLRAMSTVQNVSSPELTQLRQIRADLLAKMAAARCN